MITIQMQRTGLSHAKTTIFNLNNRDYYLVRLPTSLIIRNVMFFFVCAPHGENSVTPIVGMIRPPGMPRPARLYLGNVVALVIGGWALALSNKRL